MINMVAICGKAASGKDSILKDIMKQHSDIFYRNISLTTRPPRENEIPDIDYHFIDEEKMIELILMGEMLEVAHFNGWFYGTSLESLSKDKINISIYNPEGLDHLLSNKEVNVLIFYIQASDKTRFLRYLNREENPNINEMIRRYGTDEKDFAEFFTDENCIDHIVLYNETQADYQNILDLIVEYSKEYFKKN